MYIFDVERVATKGGSIRCYAATHGSHWKVQAIVDEMIADERSMGLYSHEIYDDLKKEMNTVAEKTRAALENEIEQGNSVASYGASATTTVLRAMLGIDMYLGMIIDDNPARQGRLSPGFKIPVKSSADLVESMPSVTVIAAWRFADLIISRNLQYIKAGGKFVVPLSTFRIVTADSR